MTTNGSASGSDLPIVNHLLIKWKPVYIEQFDLGIGKEWLLCVGLAYSDELTDLTSDVIKWLSSLPDVICISNTPEMSMVCLLLYETQAQPKQSNKNTITVDGVQLVYLPQRQIKACKLLYVHIYVQVINKC